ncbi:NAD(P)/FAD-dependent oxidoreductase [Tistrella sp. BH-R2-4]|uniref:NAD(P)/FAD-dependent oxidoreductase n=1 Tax=Tistrella arctica TaxID=3133430 RepID=A0ABU9YEN2_9PROT
MRKPDLDAVVVGAGVVGLAVAERLARAGRSVVVLEAGPRFGEGASSRNSEVVHAGLYYPPGSLKAVCCLDGRDRLKAFAAATGVGYQAVGKLVVAATADEAPRLDAILARAHANGAIEVQPVSAVAARALEPALAVHAALLSPASAIIDSHGLMAVLLARLEAADGMLITRTPVIGGRADAEGIRIATGGDDPAEITCDILVNAAGLGAPALSRAIEGPAAAAVTPPLRFAKGNYFRLDSGRAPFRRLIYPVPEAGGLGVHLTLDLAGQARFGPDVEWVDDPADLAVDAGRAPRIAEAIRRWWPAMPDLPLVPDYAGIRPKIVGPGEADADFRVDGPADHGVDGLVHLLGIESPGLTAALALAERVALALGVVSPEI